MKKFSLLLFVLFTVILAGCSFSGVQKNTGVENQSILINDAFIKEQVRCLEFMRSFDNEKAKRYCKCITQETIDNLDNEGIEYIRLTKNKTFMTDLPGNILIAKKNAMSKCEYLEPIVEDTEVHWKSSVYNKCVSAWGSKYANKCICISEKISKELTQDTSVEEVTNMMVKYNRICLQ